MKTLSCLIALLLFCGSARAQWDDWPAVVHSTTVNGVVYSEHVDGLWSAVSFDDQGNKLLCSFATDDVSQARLPQGPQSPIPMLTASWVDKSGVTHTVNTPIPSQTPSGLQKALDLHNSLVSLLQAQHPPRPVGP